VPANCRVAYIFNPRLSVGELLQSVCDEFHIPCPAQGTVKDYLDPLNAFLLQAHAAGQNCVLIIDEAQNLSADVLEQLRLLTNLETSARKLLQIVLIGQPELRTLLARPELEQLAQRVIARYHLHALSADETRHYIQHRLGVAGLTGALPFDSRALRRIQALTGGVPRRINLLCGRALLGAYAHGQRVVTGAVVDKAAREVFDAQPAGASRAGWRRPPVMLGTGLLAGGLLGMAALLGLARGWGDAGRPVDAATLAPASAAPAASSSAAAAPLPRVAAREAGPAAASPWRPAALLAREDEAWRELAPLWKLDLAETGDPCAQAPRQQVRCFRRVVSLELLRQLDRPGILTLHPDGSPPVHALLTGWAGDRVILRARGVEQAVPLAALAGLWRGAFATFWRAPPGDAAGPVAGSAGPAVDWLAARLAAVDGVAVPPGRLTVDAALAARVAAFQATQGLAPDGRVGPLTIMQINRAAGVDEPRLQVARQ
jgi:general secretion pathway protein A